MLQTIGFSSLAMVAFIGLIYGEIVLLQKMQEYKMWKIFKNNDPPEFDPIKHDPNLIFGFLTYRGICYAKWIHLKSYGISNWKVSDRGD